MSLSELSIRRPVLAWMLMAALIVFGALSFKRLGISQLPDVDFPVVSVSLSLPGAAPEVMESQVVDPVEDSIMQIAGIRSLSSSCSQSSGSIAIEFELSRNIDQAIQEVQDRIAQVQNLLPQGLIPPTVRKSNPEDTPLLWIAVTNDGSVSLMETMIYARNSLFDQFATVPGVGDIALGGYVDPALRVWVDQNKLNRLNFTADDIVNAIEKEHVEIPAGRIENNEREFNVRLMGEAPTPTEFGKILIQNRSGLGANFTPIQLSDLAKIEENTLDVRRVARFNGQMAVGLGILKQHGSNAVEVADQIREKLKQIEPTIPKAYKLMIRSDKTRFIKQSVDELMFMLLLSALFTSLVCYLFLGSWTSTLNVLLAIPTSIIGAFIAIYFLGFTLNTFTLLGLSLAIGVVVDDAIMMLENIVRHRELGEKRKRAALMGANEITFAALAATIAVVAIFIPVAFMKGIVGKYLYQYGITVSAAVLLSLLEALTLTPMRCSRFLSVSPNPRGLAGLVNHFFDRLTGLYGRILSRLLSHRVLTLFVAGLLFAASLLVAKHLPSEMMPSQDQSMLLLRLKGPVGAALPFTDTKFKIAEGYLGTLAEVEGVFSMVGGFGGSAVNQGMIFITLVDKDKRKISQTDLMKKIRKELRARMKPFQVVAQDLSLRGFGGSRGFPIEFIVQGPDWDELTKQTDKMIASLKESGVAVDVNTDIQPNMPEVQILPNREKLARHGVSLKNVTSAVNALVGGAILNGSTEYQKAGHRYEIEVRLFSDQRTRAEQLNGIRVRSNRGEAIPLSELVDLVERPSLQVISRLDRARAIKVYANPAPGHSQQEALKVAEKISKNILSPGYFLKLTGSAQSFRESLESLVMALLLGILVSYMVLASQFNSFIHPITVLLALPFSFSGAFVGLLLFHQSINIFSLIGFILLMGIVKKNSILLVDFTNQCRQSGMEIKEALVKACPVRLRPILMTSVATIAGALPEAFSMGPGAETTIPMAIAIIGGVTASTFLTLFVVPCAYSVLATFERRDPLLA